MDEQFTDQEIEKIIEFCEKKDVKIATTGQKNIQINKVRKSKISFIDKDSNSKWIFDKINDAINAVNEEFYNFNLNGYNAIQYGEYHGKEGGKYDFHMDTFLNYDGNGTETRKLSLVIMLSDPETDFKGGEFQINRGNEKTPIDIKMKKGRIIFFPSFLIHRVKQVTSGVRKSLAIWVTGPKFR